MLAEIASWQLEYTYLAKVSGEKKYMDHVGNCTLVKVGCLTVAGTQPQ